MQFHRFPEKYLVKINTNDLILQIRQDVERKRIVTQRIFALDARVLYLLMAGNVYATSAYDRCDVILPDGRPIFWIARLCINVSFKQLTGPQIFLNVINDPTLKKKRHMFYGGQPPTISRIRKKALDSGVNLVYAESPPFLGLEQMDIKYVEKMISKYRPDFFWCGLGAPKQEYLISNIESQNVYMIGVGLAFDYYAGIVKKAPKIFSLFGLEWIVRYSQQPLRFKRFVKPFINTSILLINHSVIRTRYCLKSLLLSCYERIFG